MDDKKMSARFDGSSIDLSEMLWSVLANWRKLFVWVLIFAFLAGVYSVLSENIKLNKEDYFSTVQETNEHLLANYEAAKAKLETRMRTLSEEIKHQQDYESNSPLFAIDPYNVYVYECTYYVDTGYEILPDSVYQNPDYTPHVLSAYINALNQISAEQILASLAGKESTKEYDSRTSFITAIAGNKLPSLAATENWTPIPVETAAPASSQSGTSSAVVPSDSNILSIRAISGSEAERDALADAIHGVLEENRDAISSSIHPHTLSQMNEQRYQTLSRDLLSLHERFYQNMDSLNEVMAKTLNDFNNLRRPNLNPFNRSTVIKSAMKSAVIAGFAGFLLGAVFYALLYVLRGQIINPENAAYLFQSEILAVFPQQKKTLRLDNAVRRHLGLPTAGSRLDFVRLAAANIRQISASSASLLFAGGASPEQIEALCRDIQPLLPGYSVSYAGNIGSESDAVEQLMGHDSIVLVEKAGKTDRQALSREIRLLNRCGKTLLGFVFIEE